MACVFSSEENKEGRFACRLVWTDMGNCWTVIFDVNVRKLWRGGGIRRSLTMQQALWLTQTYAFIGHLYKSAAFGWSHCTLRNNNILVQH